MANGNNLKPIQTLPPFKRLCCTIGALPSSYLESMTYFEMLNWFCDYLKNTVIPTINNNAESVKELQGLYIILKNYVDNYFKNLDVQQEINNKLDEMAESGELQNIITNYLKIKGLLIFDTINDLINSNNVINGSNVRTLGYTTINDGLGSYYKIKETGTADGKTIIKLNNGLYAHLLNYFENNYYNNISLKTYYNNHSKYYITEIPLLDENNNQINVFVGEGESGQTPSKYAQKNNTNVTINASLAYKENDGNFYNTIVIANGEIIHNYPLPANAPDNFKYLGFTKNRDIIEYQANITPASKMINDNIENAFMIYYPLISNGQKSDLSNVITNEPEVVESLQPRQAIGIREDKTLIILTVDGRSTYSHGYTSEELQNILLEQNCINAWNLDGGGSTSLTYKGIKINENIDNNRTTERNIKYTLNIKNTSRNQVDNNIYNQIGQTKQDLRNEIFNIVPIIQTVDNQNANNLISKLMFAYGNGIQNRPINSENGFFINIPHSNVQFMELYNKQFFMNRDTQILFAREQVNGVFSNWNTLSPILSKINIVNNQLLTETNVYEKIKLSNGGLTHDLISSNENNIYPINNELVKTTISLQFQAVTAGNKYIKIRKNDSEDYGVFSFTAEAQKIYTISYSDIVKCNNDEYFTYMFYGAEGDIIGRGIVTISN